MYKLRNIARRGTMFAGAGALLFASIASGSSAFADTLNPLTHRSLTLSSSSPGWSYTDGSGNNTASLPTGSPYAVPNSGANGQKAGNTFSFNVSTDSSASNTVKALTFQYCTKSAGSCYGPGNDGFVSGNAGARNPDSVANRTSDLNIVASSPSEVTPTKFGTMMNTTSGDIDTSTLANSPFIPKADGSEGNYLIMTKDAGSNTWVQNTGWTMTTAHSEGTAAGSDYPIGTQNEIVIKNASGGLALHPGGAVKIIFFGTNANYITNPGVGSFFVKINDYNSNLTQDDTTLLDGGVTVANVMNQSIQITTKVLETMEFSVGTVDPFTLSSANGDSSHPSQFETALGVAPSGDSNAYTHTPCDRILTGINAADTASQNVLQMGDTAAEDSLSTSHTYSTHSFWRLSSNSSAGATVYYSGVTLSNTVGDQVKAIGPTASIPRVGAEQFGLALTDGTLADNPQPLSTNPSSVFSVNYASENNTGSAAGLGLYENGADIGTNGIDSSVTTDVGGNASYHTPRLYPMIPAANYDAGAGAVNASYATLNGGGSVNSKFAFDTSSNTVPTPIASESNQVVDCVTGRMRYIGNIAATTPAGIYTTKINYIAAPQY